MKTSLFATIAIAAAASVISLSPALADRGGGHRGHDHRYERQYDRGHSHYHHKHYRKHRHFGFHRHWSKPRWYRYGYNPYRRWN